MEKRKAGKRMHLSNSTARIAKGCESSLEVVLTWLNRVANLRLEFHLGRSKGAYQVTCIPHAPLYSWKVATTWTAYAKVGQGCKSRLSSSLALISEAR
jgi:hypothetical protein